jgi:hypothetical protein
MWTSEGLVDMSVKFTKRALDLLALVSHQGGGVSEAAKK